MESNDELERRIDSALAGYSVAEPLAGLEERVLSRVRAREGARRRVLGWAFAFGAVAVVVVTVVAVRTPRHAGRTDRVGIPAVMRPVPVAERPRVVPVRRAKASALRPRPLPKQEQFPAPAPITAEERALLALVAHHPAEAQQVFAELQKSDEPVQIQPIQIPPLPSDGAQ
jgi:hypothetical protein